MSAEMDVVEPIVDPNEEYSTAKAIEISGNVFNSVL